MTGEEGVHVYGGYIYHVVDYVFMYVTGMTPLGEAASECCYIVSCPAPRIRKVGLAPGSPYTCVQSWGSITSAVPDLDRQCDWLTTVLHH